MAKKTDKVKNNSELAVKVETAQNNAAPAKKTNKKNANNGEKKPNIFKRMGKGFKGVISELKKVTWPKGKEVAKSTAIVLVVVVAFFIVLFGIDYVLTGLLSLVTTGKWATIFI